MSKVVVGEKKKGLYEKLFDVQQEVKMVGKNGKNTQFSYSYAKEEDFIAELKPLLGKHRLLVIQIGAKQRSENGVGYADVKYRIRDIDSEEFLDVDMFGAGLETRGNEDKAGYKALTGAMKYFLSKTFMVPTGDDPERSEKGARPGAPVASPAKKAPGKPKTPEEMYADVIKFIKREKDKKKLKKWQGQILDSTVYSDAQKSKLIDAIAAKLNGDVVEID